MRASCRAGRRIYRGLGRGDRLVSSVHDETTSNPDNAAVGTFQHVKHRSWARGRVSVYDVKSGLPLVTRSMNDGKTSTARWRVVERPRAEVAEGAREGGNSNGKGREETRPDCCRSSAEGHALRNLLQGGEALSSPEKEIAIAR